MKLSEQLAHRLRLIGDTVYILCGKKLCQAIVTGIQADCLTTDQDLLFYDEHGSFWFLTRRCAVEALKGESPCP